MAQARGCREKPQRSRDRIDQVFRVLDAELFGLGDHVVQGRVDRGRVLLIVILSG